MASRFPSGGSRNANCAAPSTPTSTAKPPLRPGMIADAPPRRRQLARLIVVLIVALAAMLGSPAGASAHPTLLFTDPAADTAVPPSPTVVTLVFNETVTVAAHAITVLDSDGRAVPMGA